MKKLIVYVGKNKEDVLKTLVNDGEILANYGESVLLQTDDTGFQRIQDKNLRFRELETKPLLTMGAFELDTDNVAMRSTSNTANLMGLTMLNEKNHYIIRLAGPIHPDWKKELEKMSVGFLETIQEDFYLVDVDSDKVDDVQNLPYVESISNYEPELKISPSLITNDLMGVLSSKNGLTVLNTDLSANTNNDDTNILDQITQKRKLYDPTIEGNIEIVSFLQIIAQPFLSQVEHAGASVIKVVGNRVIAFADTSSIPEIAKIQDVKEINPYQPFQNQNNVASGIIRADVLQNNHGLNGAGQIVAVADTGLDTGVNDASMMNDFEGRIVQIFPLGRPGNASDTDGHGTHVAGSVLGNGANSNGNVHGMAPNARLVFQSLLDSRGGLRGIPADLNTLFQQALDNGANIHTNSWGADVNGSYDSNSSEADTFTFNNRNFLVLFAAGNDGPNRIGSPATAKNVLTIGASESVRILPTSVSFPASPRFSGGLNNINFSGEADNQNQVTNFSSIGPAQNNRRKPDVVAPGSWILSTRSTVAVADTGPDGLSGFSPTAAFPTGGTGDEDGIATHAEAVGTGLPAGPILGGGNANTPPLPAGSGAGAEQFYMYQSGTSMATPIMAGACTLIRQYLIEQRSHVPSAALIKALVVNGAVDMGMGVPHNGQGWGRAELSDSLFPLTTGRVQFDDNLDNAVSTGAIRTYEVMVSSSANPLAVTLVWRDSQGASIQNRLHLRVTHIASGLTRTADAITDIRNNVQKVIFNAPTIGTYRIEVEGVNIVSGIPEFPGAFRQDYALAIANATGFSCNPIDIVQVIDHSGSMGFSGYMEPAKERAKQLIDILQINDKAGVISFNSASTENLPLTAINSQTEKNDARASITPITASGMTDLRAGLEQGRITLGNDPDRPKAIVFLSDGFHTTATPVVDDAYLDSLIAQDIKVYTVALGPDSDFDVLNNIASRTGTGAVHTVESAADLHQLSEIYYDILGNMGCNSVVHLQSAGLGQLSGKTVIIDKSVKEGLFAVSTNTLNTKIDFTLQTPSGKVITPSSVEAFYLAGSTHQFYRIVNPEVGKWKFLLKSNDLTLPITTAVLVDSNFKFRFKIDKSFLFKGQLLLFLNATYNDKALIGSKIVANGVYPTVSFKDLISKYRTDLDKIKIPDNLLKGDKIPDLDRLRFDKLSVAMRKDGRNIFEQKKFSLALTDDGKDKDPKIDDGIYTAFLDIKKRKVTGNFKFKVVIQGNHPDLGDYTRTKLVSIFVPTL